nr:PREDICTED: putative gustatory receptor clone PTE03 [Latimeria chalumnae]|eukprot:XP_006009364.2 PREDICTED: putative gustatory receptor clone PTE03 [Latimeria chalumnae]
MDNSSLTSNMILKLEGFSLSPTITNLTFILTLIVYVLTVIANAVVLGVLVLDKKLYEPMYLLLWNMSINDLIGICSTMPRILMVLLSTTNEISYKNCIVQAFFVHIYGSVSFTVLAAMAYDRYIAICNPLRYHTIMTKRAIAVLSLLVWAIPVLLVMTLFGLALRVLPCRSIIYDITCSNMGILSLTCANITVNNIYGLFMSAVLNAIALFSVIYSYAKILITCLTNKHAESKSKAVHTCSTHLLVFAIYELSNVILIISYRFNKSSRNFQHVMGMICVIIPTFANPIIYDLIVSKIYHLNHFRLIDYLCLFNN